MEPQNNYKTFFIKLASISVAIVIIINLLFNLIFAQRLEKIDKVGGHKFGNQDNFNKKIDELNQETETLIDEIEKWQR